MHTWASLRTVYASLAANPAGLRIRDIERQTKISHPQAYRVLSFYMDIGIVEKMHGKGAIYYRMVTRNG